MADSGQIDIFLNPGDYFVGDADYRVRTLLGSCVSIVLWAAHRRVGAMSHFLLPGHSPDGVPSGRYGLDALPLMLGELHGLGVRSQDCVAKVFGGGNMFPGEPRPRPRIGEKNGEAARAMLARCGIPVVSESLYGAGHRQLIFDVASGDVWVRQVDKEM
jgi:chemotaxis protein CheD